MTKNHCFLLPKPPPCFVHLGRFGDIIIMLPALKRIHDQTGIRPVMMSCDEFGSVLEGCSYVRPWLVSGLSWNRDVQACYVEALKWYSHVIVPKWWDCPGLEPPPPAKGEHELVWLKHQGRDIHVPKEDWESYQFSQWKACGFTKAQLLEWPLVFDRRSPERETELSRHYMGMAGKKPYVLYNFSGISNPVSFEPEIMRALAPIRRHFEMIDLSRIRAHRIYDLLGLYDRAACLITGDTSTLHLAAASPVPMIALLANDGAGSIPRGNTVLKLRYRELRAKVDEIKTVIEKILWENAAKAPGGSQ